MDAGLTVAFWGVAVVLVLTPGADWAYVISSGSRRGGTMPAVAGILTAHLAAMLAVVAGAAAILAAWPLAITVITVAGACYLVWLGISALRQSRESSHLATTERPAARLKQIYTKGVGIGILNPKVFLFYLALLPQFISPRAAWPESIQLLTLGAIQIAMCAVVYTAVGFGAAAALKARPKAERIVFIISGSLMIALGLFLLVEEVVEVLAPVGT